jgi:hypothetical protein
MRRLVHVVGAVSIAASSVAAAVTLAPPGVATAAQRTSAGHPPPGRRHHARRPAVPKLWRRQAIATSSLVDSLDAVSCPRVSACVAVGSGLLRGTVAVESWNGTRWTVTRPPTPTGASSSELTGVSCAGPSACEAVGSSQTGPIEAAMTVLLGERWDGKRWTLQTVPAPGPIATLSGISCATAHACMAVGSWETIDLVPGVFAERWNGRRWSLVSMRLPAGPTAIDMNAVSCPATNACVAVGDYVPAGKRRVALAERWDGRRWTIEHPIVPVRRADATLSSVSCLSRRACIAVGSYDLLGFQVPMAQQRLGALWSLEPLPGTLGAPLQPASLAGVSCLRPETCSAVGTVGAIGPGAPGGETLAERWGGARWTLQPAPSPAASDELLGVSCASLGMCMAVGDDADASGGGSAVLVERFS